MLSGPVFIILGSLMPCKQFVQSLMHLPHLIIFTVMKCHAPEFSSLMQYYMWDLFFLWLVVIQDGATLMHYAVQTACSQTIKTLLLYNVDINHPDDVCLSAGISLLYFLFCWLDLTHSSITLQYGWTPLHLAVQTQRTDIVKLLLIKGADRTLKTQVSKVNILKVLKWFSKNAFVDYSIRTHLWIDWMVCFEIFL